MNSPSETAQAAAPAAEGADAGPMPGVDVPPAQSQMDFATLVGLIGAVSMIIIAIVIGKSKANFFDVPSFLIVIVGTIAATTISYTLDEVARAGSIIGKSLFRKKQSPLKLSKALISLSVIAKKKGILALGGFEKECKKDPFLARSIQLVIDGFQPNDIEQILEQEVQSLKERHKRSASILLRGSEIAPAMGLIGTLVGLVQMLADLQNPESIGPAMAVALLTTFYGAILGSVVLAPMAVKLEKNSNDEALLKTLIKTAAASIARQENPRRLEMLLNAELPPSEQVSFFD